MEKTFSTHNHNQDENDEFSLKISRSSLQTQSFEYMSRYNCEFSVSNKENFKPSLESSVFETKSHLPIVTKEVLKPNGSVEVIDLKPINEIPERFRSIFPFKYFNALQSKAFENIMYSDKQTVICAPTGSGKTVLLELCIVRLLLTSKDNFLKFKMIYMAPIKALCSERYLDWKKKFSEYGLKCQELTGDTEIDDFQEISMSHIILTTPEKWDSMTRRWKDHKTLVQSIRLFMIDEVHLINDDIRGATLEAVVSRMKTVQVSISKDVISCGSPMRFVAVSATIPNVHDVASWLDTGISPAIGIKFGEEYRPVALRKVVLGYPFQDSQTDFKFDMMLSFKLSNLIKTYSDNKPTIVFCNTRKSVMHGASILVKDARFSMNCTYKQTLTRYANMIRDSKLKECVYQGVAFHHAGLEISDRKNIEEMFAKGCLPVLFCTSTLAMGVNLPAHLVIIKGTMYYMMGGFAEYSEAQILQMMGRAGRPQFDTSATAVIMTKEKTKVKYQGLVFGNQNIESSLHLHLTEHIMAEIVLGTINDIYIAKEWLKSTFLYRRMLENPKHYGAPENLDREALGKKLQAMCLETLKSLESFELISLKGKVNISPTETGKLMSKFCIAFETVKTISTATGTESLEELIILLSKSKELEDLKIRSNEKKILNALNHDKNHQTIRFPMDTKIKTTEMKVNCLLQAGLGCLAVTDFSLSQDTIKLFQVGQRIARFMMEYFMQHRKFQIVLNSIILFKCIKAKLWENSKHVSKQLEKIGTTLSSALVNAGITSFSKIEETNPRELEMIMSRHPPFGSQVHDAVAALPKYVMTVEQEGSFQEHSCNLLLIVKLINFHKRKEYLKSKEAKPLGCMIVVGDQDNNLVFKHRLMEYQVINSGAWSRKIIINVSEESENHTLNFYLLNLDYIGLDVQCEFTPVYLSYFPKRIKLENSRYLEKSEYLETSSLRSECNHRCIDKFNCGHACCKSHLQSIPCVSSRKKKSDKIDKQNSGYKESLVISQLHKEIYRRCVLPNVAPLERNETGHLFDYGQQDFNNKSDFFSKEMSNSESSLDYSNWKRNHSLNLDQYNYKLSNYGLSMFNGNKSYKQLDNVYFDSMRQTETQSVNPNSRFNFNIFDDTVQIYHNQSSQEQNAFDEDIHFDEHSSTLPISLEDTKNSQLPQRTSSNYLQRSLKCSAEKNNVLNTSIVQTVFNFKDINKKKSTLIDCDEEKERNIGNQVNLINSCYTVLQSNDNEESLLDAECKTISNFEKPVQGTEDSVIQNIFMEDICHDKNISIDQFEHGVSFSSHLDKRIDANMYGLKYSSKVLNNKSKEKKQAKQIEDLKQLGDNRNLKRALQSFGTHPTLFNGSLSAEKTSEDDFDMMMNERHCFEVKQTSIQPDSNPIEIIPLEKSLQYKSNSDVSKNDIDKSSITCDKKDLTCKENLLAKNKSIFCKRLIAKTSSNKTDINQVSAAIEEHELNPVHVTFSNQKSNENMKSIYNCAKDKLAVKIDTQSGWQRSLFYDCEVESTSNDCKDMYKFSDQNILT